MKNITRMNQIVPASYLHLLKNFIFNEYTVDITNILNDAGYALPENPSEFISFEHFSNACALILKEVTDPELGLKYGNQLNFISHGPLGAAFMSCKKVGDMMELLIRFINTRFLFRVEFIPGTTHSTCIIHCAPPCMPNIVFHSQCILAGFFNIMSEIIGVLHKDISIDFPYPQPEIIDKYRSFFPVTLNFNKPTLAVIYPNSYLQYSLPKHDETSKQMFVDMCENIKQVMAKKQSLAGVIDEMLDAYDSYPSLEQVAQNLNISGRTLRTRLQKEDSSFRKVLANHRIQRSKVMLISTDTNIEVIADILGYSDAANFNRAFKKEMSIAPTAYRKQHK